MPPNIIVVVMDAARRDAFEPYGAVPGSTPAVAQLARRGVALDEVYATSCWTVPSHASMFTGLLPRAAGLSQVPSPDFAKPVMRQHRERCLPEVMRRAGYVTGAASANLWVSRAAGFDVGFDDFAEAEGDRNAQIHLTSAKERLRWLIEAAKAEADDGARAMAATLDEWASDTKRRPFFWFVNMLECHSPYLPPRPYGNFSRLARLRAAQDARRYYTLESFWRTCAGVDTVPQSTLLRLRRFYDAAIRSMDDWLARLVESLESAGVLDETLLVVLSDHGENFGESGLTGHGLSLDNRLIKVPFVAAGPGADRLSPVSLADLPKSLAQIADVSEHPWHDGPPPGVGVAQFDPPVDRDDEDGRRALAEIGIAGEAHERFTTPLTCAVAGNLKVLRRGEREEVYDLVADPGEAQPLAPDAPTLANREPDLRRLRSALEHPSVTQRREASAERPSSISDAERTDLEDRMRLLGYL